MEERLSMIVMKGA